MSAVNSLQPPSSPGAEQRPYEPSMEEILASIRRIIADDQPLPPTREPAAPPGRAPAASVDEAPPVAPEAAIHAPAEPSPPPEFPARILPEPVPVAPQTQPHGHIAAPQFPIMPEGTVAPAPETDTDLAADLAEAVDLDPMETLETVAAPASTVHDHAYDVPQADDAYRAPDAGRGGPAPVHRQPPSPEGLFSKATDHSVTAAFNALAASRLADNSEELLGIARDMIRPLLKAWIDDNLPSMVERMVRAEIERVARGGR